MSLTTSSESSAALVLSARRAALQRVPTSAAQSILLKRCFTWGGKQHKWSSPMNCKNDKVWKANISKSSIRYPYLERKAFYRRFLPAQGWRSSSQWMKSSTNHVKANGRDDSPSNSPQETDYEDWYSRWERRQIENFEAFKKKIDEDPYQALFGHSNRWLNWASEAAARTAAKVEEQSELLNKKMDKDAANIKTAKEVQDCPPSMTTENNKRTSDATVTSEIHEQVYEIDPITLRKIPKSKNQAAPSTETPAKKVEDGFKIPVKTFKPSPPPNNMLRKGNVTTQVDDWLAREGFSSARNARKPVSPNEYGTTVKPKGSTSKIQSALDRHVQEKSIEHKESKVDPESSIQKKNDEEANGSQNSNIHASAKAEDEPAKELDVAPDARRQALMDRYKRQQQWLKEELKHDYYGRKDSELLRKKAADTSLGGSSAGQEAIKAINDRFLNELSSANAPTGKPGNATAMPLAEAAKAEKLSSFVNENTRRIQSKIVPLKNQIDLLTVEYSKLRQKWLEETRRMKERKIKRAEQEAKLLNAEIQAQKDAMKTAEEYRSVPLPSNGNSNKTPATGQGAEGDMSPNVVDFALRDRWYKRKAPHAQCEMEAKTQQIAKDRALIREIRAIYEDTYGVIDTKHRQEELHSSPKVVDIASLDDRCKQRAPATADSSVISSGQKPVEDKNYTMLMDDPLTETSIKDDTAATTSTSVTAGSSAPTPNAEQHSSSQISSQNPTIPVSALRQIANLQAQLDQQASQLKKHRKEIRHLRATKDSFIHDNNGSTKPEQQEAAALRDHDHEHKQKKPGIVRRTEPVFSGRKQQQQQQQHKHHSKRASQRRRRTLKHVLLTGVVTAACCYATGVVVELVKVGGL